MAADLIALARRDLLLRQVRAFFHARGFIEVETPLVVPSPGLELHLDALEVAGAGWLITSPEYQMKRLLAAGAPRIFQICKCFRRGEVGPHHSPEFTMLEWYRAESGYEQIMDDCETLVPTLARELTGTTRLRIQDHVLDLTPPWERLTVRQAFERWAGHAPAGDTPSDTFFQSFLDRVEAHLGRSRPTLLHDWPASMAQLARRKPGAPELAERFELFIGGLELANGFGELTDPIEQRSRFKADLAARRRLGKPLYPIDERFLDDLARMPASGGVALGLDRLAMLLLGAPDIRDVLAFAADEL
jgi:lysyl-tRNA synthetase class 2